MTNEVCIEDDGLLGSKTVYLSQYYYSEKGVAYRLVQLNAARMWEMEGLSAEEFEKVQESANMKLGDRQREAVFAAFNSGVFVLTGGPGTGKTTTLRMIIDIFRGQGEEGMSGSSDRKGGKEAFSGGTQRGQDYTPIIGVRARPGRLEVRQRPGELP